MTPTATSPTEGDRLDRFPASFFFKMLILLGGLLCFGAHRAHAEPWLSTRYAQNCAGCHGPGRKNLEAPDRRCSLSCQGCHVNPNGGGVRSFYGKWNEERWLRSFRSSLLADARTPVPVAQQRYGRTPWAKRKKIHHYKRIALKDGFKLVESKEPYDDDAAYGRDGLEFEISKSKDEFLYQVPDQDPYRLLDRVKTSASADARWEITNYSQNGDAAKFHSFLMDVDFGIDYRPFYRYLHIVYENRMEGAPEPKIPFEQQVAKSQTRSLYALVDSLPFNSFVMAGYYRPLFGNYVPDHYTLAQEVTAYGMTGQTKNYNLLFDAVSAGTAPNVPYLNLHMIRGQLGDPNDNTKGYAANVGLRFVTLGASVNYSFWSTTDERAARTVKTQLHSIDLAARFFRTVTSLEAVSVARDVDTTDFRQGGVWTLDTYTQVWRENYLTLLFAKSNVTTEIKPGNAMQIKVGVRSFVIPGVDTMLVYQTRTDTANDPATGTTTTTKLNGFEGQLHLYF